MSRKVSVQIAADIDGANAHYVTITDGDYSRTVAVHTNRSGEGLWEDGRQIAGTSQFDLNVKDQAAKLRRFYLNGQ